MHKMKHITLFEQLKKRLSQTLPGVAAQEKMASSIRTALRLKADPDELTRKSAVLLLFYPEADQIFLPMIVRPVYTGVHSGQVAFPGGRMEDTDRDLPDTALREAHEEIGIPPATVEVLGLLSPLFIPASNYIVYPVVGAIDVRPDFNTDPREVAQLLEIPLNDLLDATRIGTKEIVVRDNITIQAPFYDLQGQMVWGASAMILSELLVVLEEIGVKQE
jgi:8-oxo-dGTP pyrophosphatase MutT (NUDIX family)